jgi:hypothetical protein
MVVFNVISYDEGVGTSLSLCRCGHIKMHVMLLMPMSLLLDVWMLFGFHCLVPLLELLHGLIKMVQA